MKHKLINFFDKLNCLLPIDKLSELKKGVNTEEHLFHKITLVAASEKFINFTGKHQWQRYNGFIFFINMTE